MNELISVIVPVYNVEKYLNRCLCSITEQTYSNLEVILVDDGSLDRSPDICDEWHKKDSRITVIHQNNKGAGRARNTGIDVATGQFFCFIDSDDYISTDMFEYLYGLFDKDIDIAECKWKETVTDTDQFDQLNETHVCTVYDSQEAMKGNIRDTVFRQVIWNKMYRRKVIDGVYFPEGRKIDDEFWTYRVIGKANKLARSNRVLYAYRQQETSVMHVFDEQKSLEAIEAKVMRHKYICRNMPQLETDSLLSVWQTCIYQGQQAIKKMDRKHCKMLFAYIRCITEKYPIGDKIAKMNLLPKQKVWLRGAQSDIYSVCKVRNYLGIGL